MSTVSGVEILKAAGGWAEDLLILYKYSTRTCKAVLYSTVEK